MNEDIAVKIENVSKDFILPHQKANSVKSIFTGLSRAGKGMAETQHALKDISFEVKKGEFFGIVGRNGSGKSTLLKIIAEIYRPTIGSVTKSGRLVPFIELGVGFNPELTGRENVYLNGALLGFSTKEIDDQYDDIVQFAELEQFMDQKLKNYSSGMQVRLAFSVATRANADIMLIDEVLAVGDADFQRKCFDYFKKLKKQKMTVIFVSHDMGAVKEFCDRVILIDKSQIIAEGPSHDVADNYTKLFNASPGGVDIDNDPTDKRWGSREIAYSSVTVDMIDDRVKITTTIDAKKAVDTVLFGVHVSSKDGQEIFATNNRMVGVDDLINLSAGDKAVVAWDILNVFSDGEYDVTVTLADPVSTVYDWYYDAAQFRVRRSERSVTPIFPPTTISTKLIRGEKNDKQN